VLAKTPRNHQDQGHHGRSAARGRALRARRPKDAAVVSEISGVVHVGEALAGPERSPWRARRARPASTRSRRSPTSSCRTGSGADRRIADRRPVDPTTCWPFLVRRAAALSRGQDPGGLSHAGRHDQRQAHRDHRASDVPVREVTDPATPSSSSRSRCPRTGYRRRTTGSRRCTASRPASPRSPRNNEGGARDRVVRLGGLVPGDHRVLTEAAVSGGSTT